MALELASRALNAEPAAAEDGSVTRPATLFRARCQRHDTQFRGGANDIEIFVRHLRACVERNNTDFFHPNSPTRSSSSALCSDLEDRKLTSKRFATGLDGSRASRCALPPAPLAAGQFKRSSIAGVYIHATAVQNLIARDAIVELAVVAGDASSRSFFPPRWPRSQQGCWRRAPPRGLISAWPRSGHLRNVAFSAVAGIAADRANPRRHWPRRRDRRLPPRGYGQEENDCSGTVLRSISRRR